MYQILFVDDEDAIREGFAEYAGFLGHEVTQARDGMEAVALCRARDFDVVVLDIMMPRMDGFTACKEIRREKDIPVLMLSARGEEYDKLHGFDLGIDDYVTKPFSPKEVIARLNVIVQRHRAAKTAGETGHAQGENEVYRFGGLVADVTARTVEIDGARQYMTPKEYDLLFYLMHAQPQYRPQPRKAAAGGVGLRLLRRGLHREYAHQSAAAAPGGVRKAHRDHTRGGVQV